MTGNPSTSNEAHRLLPKRNTEAVPMYYLCDTGSQKVRMLFVAVTILPDDGPERGALAPQVSI